MNTLFVVACGAQKRAVRSPANELYTGSLFRAAYSHARRFAKEEESIHILSAKHGLIPQGQLIEPYDVSLESLDAHARGRLVSLVRSQLPRGPVLPLRVVMLASAAYVDLFRRACIGSPFENVPLRTPLAGLGMPEQRRWLYSELYPTHISMEMLPLSSLCAEEDSRLRGAAHTAALWWANTLMRESPPPEPSSFGDALARELRRVWDEVYSRSRGEWPEDVGFPITFQNAPGGHIGAALAAIGINEGEWWKREWCDRHLTAYMHFSMNRVTVRVGDREQLLHQL